MMVTATVLVFTAQFVSGQLLLIPDRIFDGETLRQDVAVLVSGSTIEAVAPAAELRRSARGDVQVIELPGTTLLPGLIDAHSHLLLHPYDETSWNDQVLRESDTLRAVRAVVHARRTLEAGFTTLRDLGSEGAGYTDVGVRDAIRAGIVPGPDVLVAGRAIVATGSYGPKGFKPTFDVPLGAEPADGSDLVRVVRDQIGKGADLVKVYADYRWGPSGEARPTFSEDELRSIVETAASSGRSVVAHAGTAEGMRRATLAGVVSIEHGDGGSPEVFELMAERGVALCPTLGAVEAISRYGGWNGEAPSPERIRVKRRAFEAALDAGVPMCVGSDVGVFDHGDNAWELELMVDYGMATLDVLKAATSGNAELLDLPDRGRIGNTLRADLVSVQGNPAESIAALRDVVLVIKEGQIVFDQR